MIIFENEDNRTYIMGNYCLNDDHIFNKNNAQKIFDEYNVPKHHQDFIMNSFYNELTPDDKIISDDYDIILLQIMNKIIFDEYIHHDNHNIRRVVAIFGTDKIKM